MEASVYQNINVQRRELEDKLKMIAGWTGIYCILCGLQKLCEWSAFEGVYLENKVSID